MLKEELVKICGDIVDGNEVPGWDNLLRFQVARAVIRLNTRHEAYEKELEKLRSMHDRHEAVVKAGWESLGLMCRNGKHADEGCKACALAVALRACEGGK